MKNYLRSRLLRAIVWIVVIPSSQLLASPERPLIGLSLNTFSADRWQRERDTFVARVESLGGRVIVKSAEWRDDVQATDIETMLQSHVDVLLIVPHDARGLGRVLKLANAAKVPVVSYDRLILGEDISYYIGADGLKLGELQAQYVADRLPANRVARIIRLFGSPTDNNAKAIKEGQDRVLAPLLQAGKVEFVTEEWVEEWKPEIAKRIVATALAKAGNTIDAIIASNDGMAGGAIEALTAQGLSGKVIVTGQDADLAACARIKDGTQAMTIYKPLDKLATLAAELAIDIAHGKSPAVSATVDNGFKVVPAIYTDVVTIDRSNLATVIAWRLHRSGGP